MGGANDRQPWNEPECKWDRLRGQKEAREKGETIVRQVRHPEHYTGAAKMPDNLLLIGPPGTGKTLLAKAVANQTSATFLRVTGSELIQKYLGDGPKLVRELFRLVKGIFLLL